jgi:hypothetical protein
MSRTLPNVVTESDEYETLTSEERASYLRRLENARELGFALSTGARRKDSLNFFQFVENLELDVSYLQEFDSPRGGGLSRWLVHYSWTFYTSPGAMRDSLAPELLQHIDAADPLSDAPLLIYEEWLKNVGQALVVATDAIFAATTYDAAMSHQVVSDILLSRLLTVCYKLRLNRLVPR